MGCGERRPDGQGRQARLTSVISKTLSGSRLPPPTFLTQVTVPLCVTEMMRLATEQAFSCRVASTTCLWPTCRKQRLYIHLVFCLKMGFRNSSPLSVKQMNVPCTRSLYKGHSLHLASYSRTGHLTARFPFLLRHLLIYALWEFCR